MSRFPAPAGMCAVELDRHQLLRISGEDRIEFLQGQLTQDVDRIDPRHSRLAGWTTAKGRLLAVGQLLPGPEALWWPLPADIIDGIARRLGLFVLRAKVEIAVMNFAVAGLIGLAADAPLTLGNLELPVEPGAAASADEPGAGELIVARLIGDPTRAWLCGPAEHVRAVCTQAGFGTAGIADWQLADITAGLPGICAATSEAFIPQMLNLDLLDGISFTKGCYVGQEIVARTQNLGRIKRRMYRFTTKAAGLEPGATIHGPSQATGKIVSVAPNGGAFELTAVIAIDQSDGQWFADDAASGTLERLELPYAVG
ncbi:MAG: folate-binding protein [Gammaproteobacteria bacterium]|nr:MAG: folate-binding protein [Gammaproteobacteria bacterium]